MSQAEKLRRGALYPLVDRCLLQIEPGLQWRARWSGEKRPPGPGEWYLSGSSIGAYRTLQGMSYPYHIAELVKVRVKTVEVVVEADRPPTIAQ